MRPSYRVQETLGIKNEKDLQRLITEHKRSVHTSSQPLPVHALACFKRSGVGTAPFRPPALPCVWRKARRVQCDAANWPQQCFEPNWWRVHVCTSREGRRNHEAVLFGDTEIINNNLRIQQFAALSGAPSDPRDPSADAPPLPVAAEAMPPMTPRTYRAQMSRPRRSYVEQLKAESDAIDAMALVPAGASARRMSLLAMNQGAMARRGSALLTPLSGVAAGAGALAHRLSLIKGGSLPSLGAAELQLQPLRDPDPEIEQTRVPARTDSRGRASFIADEALFPPAVIPPINADVYQLDGAASDGLASRRTLAGDGSKSSVFSGMKNVLKKNNSVRPEGDGMHRSPWASYEKRKLEYLWPRDTLFKYFQTMESIQVPTYRPTLGKPLTAHTNLSRPLRFARVSTLGGT
jgi:hypothetical protein